MKVWGLIALAVTMAACSGSVDAGGVDDDTTRVNDATVRQPRLLGCGSLISCGAAACGKNTEDPPVCQGMWLSCSDTATAPDNYGACVFANVHGKPWRLLRCDVTHVDMAHSCTFWDLNTPTECAGRPSYVCDL